MSAPRFVLIANPETKRCRLFLDELRAAGVTEIAVVPWATVVEARGNLDRRPEFDAPAIVRLESPGRDDRVTRLLLEAGANNDPRESAIDWRTRPMPKGLLLRPGLWYRGFNRVLTGLQQAFDARPHLQLTANALHCTELFDKTATSQRLVGAGIPVPAWCEEPQAVLRELVVHQRPMYLKLNTGSNAMGIVALRPNRQNYRGITSVAEIDGEFYNTRRLRHLDASPALTRVIDFILQEGAIAQEAIAMAQVDGQNVDLRVVCLKGTPVACIFRVSPQPMTNLHLGGQRGDYDTCRRLIPTRIWLDALDHCAEGAQCYKAHMVGIDLVFERGWQRYFILEVNAFGDFFPGWTNHEGKTIHQLEIAALLGQ